MLNALLTSVIWAEVSLFVLILSSEQFTVKLRSLPFTVQRIISFSPGSLTDFTLPHCQTNNYLSIIQYILVSYLSALWNAAKCIDLEVVTGLTWAAFGWLIRWTLDPGWKRSLSPTLILGLLTIYMLSQSFFYRLSGLFMITMKSNPYTADVSRFPETRRWNLCTVSFTIGE